MIRLSYAMIDLYCASDERAPASVILDIDDTVDEVHGHQPLALFNAHDDERCFLSIDVYDTTMSRPVAMGIWEGATRLMARCIIPTTAAGGPRSSF